MGIDILRGAAPFLPPVGVQRSRRPATDRGHAGGLRRRGEAFFRRVAKRAR